MGKTPLAGPDLTARGPPQGPDDFPVVGIGASAGGLDACTKLLGALPPTTGMAFILVQHLDPTHESMMPELLAHHTSMTVVQAGDGMRLEREHLYIIPPGTVSLRRQGRACTSPNRKRVTAPDCHSTSCCARWRRNTGSARSA